MISIDHDSSQIKHSNYAKYSIETWKRYCDKYGIDFVVCSTMDDRVSTPVWNKELIFEYVAGKSYDKIGIVDNDTMVINDNLNIFDMYDDEFCGVPDMIDVNWLFSSIDSRQKFFPEFKLDVFKYINAGVIFFTTEHLSIFKNLFQFYKDNQVELDNWDKGGGKEQTLLNFFIQMSGVKLKLLDISWNTMGLHTRNLFKNNWQIQNGPAYFLKYSHIAHFTGFPPEHRESLMKTTLDILNGQQ